MSASQSAVDPASLKLVLYPHPALLKVSAEVPMTETGFVEPDLVKAVAERMTKVMLSMGSKAIGLAANQVGLNWRMFVCLDHLNDEAVKDKKPRVYINPRVLSSYGGLEPYDEGCLSLPGVKGQVMRHSTVQLSYIDLDGHEQLPIASGLQARCWLHELDHLSGINIVDKFSEADRKRNSAILDRLRSK